MNQTSEGKFDIREEIKLVPTWVMVLAAVLFVGLQVLLFVVWFPHHQHAVMIPRDQHAPPLPVQVLIALFAGSVLIFFTLLVGYVNRDAKRRGMNYILWTVLVLIIPNAIGYVVYFVVRQPLRGACSQCGATVNPSFNFCPKCKFLLRPACPQCHRTIEVGAAFCPYCSAELKDQV